MKRKIIILTILVCTSLAFISCGAQKKVTSIESLLSLAYDGDSESVACAIASQPSKDEVLREYQKMQRAKPLLSDYNTRYTRAHGREKDATDKIINNENSNWEELYTKLTEAERIELRKRDYNNDVKRWKEEPQQDTNYYFSSLESAIKSLSQTNGIRLVDRDKTEAILAEHQFQNASLWNSNENIAEVGKMLNVQYLVFINSVVGSNSIKSQFEFVNVSTFQKITLQPSNYYNEFSKQDIDNVINSAYQDEQKAYSVDILDGTWLCNGIKSNGVKYTSEKRAYLTPFSSAYSLVDISKPPKKFSNKDLTNAKLEISGDYAYLTRGKGNKTEFDFSYAPENSHIFGPRRNKYDEGDSNYIIVSFTDFFNGRCQLKQKMTDNYIGVVTLIGENLDDSISGNAYKQGNVFAINIGSEKEKEYFLVFTKVK